MSDQEKYEVIVVEGFTAELTDNEIKRQLFDAGADFDDLKKLFKTIVESQGLRFTPKERAVKAEEFLEGYEPTDVESHLGKVSALQDFLKSTTTEAGASMRKWAKAHNIELPKAPVASKAKPGFKGNSKRISDWVLAQENPGSLTLEQIEVYAKESVPQTSGGNDAYKGPALTIFNAVVFANAMNATVEEVEVEAEVEEMEEAA